MSEERLTWKLFNGPPECGFTSRLTPVSSHQSMPLHAPFPRYHPSRGALAGQGLAEALEAKKSTDSRKPWAPTPLDRVSRGDLGELVVAGHGCGEAEEG